MHDARPQRASQQVSQILIAVKDGKRDASSALLPLVYADLRKLAAARMAKLGPGQTLQATDLVHEAYLRLVGSTDAGWQGRAHFFGAAARAMRDVIAEHLERRNAAKRSGQWCRVDLDSKLGISCDGPSAEMLAVEEARRKFERDYPRKAEVVTLRFYGGLTVEEIAEVLGQSTRTIERDWQFAKAWLNSRLADKGRG
jgi:RNA polymerase sigma factor (TIGR02999 family)